MEGRMTDQLAFLTRLRRERERRGLTLPQLEQRTNIHVVLWRGFEDNDFSRWPTGLFARAFVRAYAAAVGLDPDETVDDFCRWFPQGDRRAERMLRAQAELVGLDSQWRDEWDRRQTPKNRRRSGAHAAVNVDEPGARRRRRRLVAAGLDAAAVVSVAAPATLLFRVPVWPALAVSALGYHVAMTLLFGASGGQIFVDRYLDRLAALLTFRRRAVAA